MSRFALALAAVLIGASSRADDLVRLGNLKFAHYGAVSYMQQACKKYGVEVQETMFAKGIDIFPAIVRGEVDLAASAADAAIANRAAGGRIFVVAGFAKGAATVRLTDKDGGTLLSYDVESQIGGKLAQLGQRLIAGAAKKMADDFFAKFAAAVATSG